VLGPGVRVGPGAVIRESVVLTDVMIGANAKVERAILDKRSKILASAQVGSLASHPQPAICMLGKNSIIPEGMIVEAGGLIGTDVIETDYPAMIVRHDDYIPTKRLPHEV
jgi:glucose-1-phosphate adenylyltransferase